MSLELIKSWCPICGWDVENLTNTCVNCWKEFSINNYSKINTVQDTTKDKIDNAVERDVEKRFNFSNKNFESYSITLDRWNNTIKSISFKHKYNKKEYKFRLAFKYNDYWDLLWKKIIKDLKIAKKVRNWYGEYKFPNYYNYIWINKWNINEFVSLLLLEFSNN
jgi:hypothetical protein